MKMRNIIIHAARCCAGIANIRIISFFKGLFLITMLFIWPGPEILALEISSDDHNSPTVLYDMVPVYIRVEGVGDFDFDVLYTDDEKLFVNIEELFNTLQISCSSRQQGKDLIGFIENESHAYLIDFDAGKIQVGNITLSAPKRLLEDMGSYYMESSLLEEAFGIILNFDYRSLSIKLNSNFELPINKSERLAKIRDNISGLNGDLIADSIVKRNYHLLRLGTMDYSAASFQRWKGKTDNQFGIGMGAEFLYGEFNLAVNYYDKYDFDSRNIKYLWRWIDNEKSLIKQAQIGKISNHTISFINAPVIGAVVRNSPTTLRKAKGYYTINDITEPNWTVELYINDILVDYTEADASGSFMFEIPMVYGYTTLKLKYYGTQGEERTEERTMNIPYTVMPAGEFEYGISAGILEDSSFSRFGKAEINYGLNRFITLGGGLEYLSSIPNGPFIPYARATIQPFDKLTLNGEYAHGVRTTGTLNYYLYKNAMLEINYAKYAEGQLATRFNALEESKIKLSVPFRRKNLSGYAKIDLSQLVYSSFNYNYASLMFSAYYKNFSANSSSQLNWVNMMSDSEAINPPSHNSSKFITTNLSLSYRMKKGFTMRPSVRYDVSNNKILSYKMSLEKYFPKGYFSVTYEKHTLAKGHFINLNLKYDLPFARTGISSSYNNGELFSSQSIQGSLAFDSETKFVRGSKNSSVSKGGISLYPFLDINQNNVFDEGEKMVKLTSVKVAGAKAVFSDKDLIVRIPNLHSFTRYTIQFDDNDLENIGWQFKNKTYAVLVDPNQFKRVDIPIIVRGEINGMVTMESDSQKRGLGRILVNIYRKNDTRVAQVLSESDGYIHYLGLDPGAYYAEIDTVQLNSLKIMATPARQSFIIRESEEGDIADDIDFILTSLAQPEKMIDTEAPSGKTLAASPHEQPGADAVFLSEGYNQIEEEAYFVQVGAFKNILLAKSLAKKTQSINPFAYGVFKEDGLNKIRIGYFTSHEDADSFKAILTEKGISSFVGSSEKYVYWGSLNTMTGPYFLQAGAFRKESNARQYAQHLKTALSYPVGIIIEDGYHKVRIGYFNSENESQSCYEFMQNISNSDSL